MKRITINVSERVYAEFQAAAKSAGRPTSELIGEAMELYRRERLRPVGDLAGFRLRSAGRVMHPLTGTDDLLDEILNLDS